MLKRKAAIQGILCTVWLILNWFRPGLLSAGVLCAVLTAQIVMQDFIEEIRSGKSSPLKNITSNYHYHTVEADSEEVLDLIGEELNKRGYLVNN